MFPDKYSPIAGNRDFHTRNDSPALRLSYSSRNLSLSLFSSVPTSSRTLVLILTDSTCGIKYFSINSFRSEERRVGKECRFLFWWYNYIIDILVLSSDNIIVACDVTRVCD